MHRISCTIWIRRKAPVGIRYPQVLMVQNVINLPTEREVPVLSKLKILAEGKICVPELRHAHTSDPESFCAEAPKFIVRISLRRSSTCGDPDNVRVRTKACLKGIRVPPTILALFVGLARSPC